MNAKISPHDSISSVEDSNFTRSIKALESVLEYDCNIEVIKKLMEHYTIAIENYESKRDPVYTIYKQKLRNLLKRSDVQKEIKNQQNLEVQPPKRHRAFTNGSMRKRYELSTERVAEKALQWHRSENILTTEKIQENLKKQIDLLNSKINVRKKQSEQNAKIRAFEKGVEEIME